MNSFTLLFQTTRRHPFAALLFAIWAAIFSPHASAIDGEVDPTFVSDLRRARGANVSLALLLPGEKILVAGTVYTNAGGATPLRSARLQPDGALDPTFAVSLLSGSTPTPPACAAVQPDGKILMGGSFTSVNGTSQAVLARLNADGSLDSSFVPPAFTHTSAPAVIRMVLQPDGKVIIAGFFNSVGGQPRTRIARLNDDGSLDAAFNPVFVRDASTPNLNALALQSDGKVLVGGVFASVNGAPRSNFARLNGDGTTDSLTLDANNAINAIVLEMDGRFTAAGTFTTVRGLPYGKVVRVNADGSLDGTFTPAALPDIVGISTMSQQVDGRLIVGGNGVIGNPGPIARLNGDGSLDASFVVPAELRHAGGAVNGVVPQADGRILLARTIAISPTVDDNPLPLVRLQNGPGTQSITVEPARVRWLRSGPLPEVNETVFQLSTNGGATWTSLGVGTRVAGGWECAGLSLPSRGIVRVLSRAVATQMQGTAVGLMEVRRPFHFAGSEIAVEQPADRPVAPGGSRVAAVISGVSPSALRRASRSSCVTSATSRSPVSSRRSSPARGRRTSRSPPFPPRRSPARLAAPHSPCASCRLRRA